VRPFDLVDGIRIPIGRAIRQIVDAQGTVVALAPERGAHHIIP
jgi:hypothetical protein